MVRQIKIMLTIMPAMWFAIIAGLVWRGIFANFSPNISQYIIGRELFLGNCISFIFSSSAGFVIVFVEQSLIYIIWFIGYSTFLISYIYIYIASNLTRFERFHTQSVSGCELSQLAMLNLYFPIRYTKPLFNINGFFIKTYWVIWNSLCKETNNKWSLAL